MFMVASVAAGDVGFVIVDKRLKCEIPSLLHQDHYGAERWEAEHPMGVSRYCKMRVLPTMK